VGLERNTDAMQNARENKVRERLIHVWSLSIKIKIVIYKLTTESQQHNYL
jgi:hypothetical protein